MSINNFIKKIKHFASGSEARGIYSALIILFVGVCAFGLGRLSKSDVDGPGVEIQYPQDRESGTVVLPDFSENSAIATGSTDANNNTSAKSPPADDAIIASKNGTKYYFASCSGASRIKEENKIRFATESEAIAAGYSKSSTCK